MSYDLKASVQTVAGEIRISNVATEIKVGDTALIKRHQLKFRNESSYEMHYCFSETDCVYNSNRAVRLRSGDIGEYSSGEVERVMKPSTDYVIEITNNSTTADGVGHSSITWYESGEQRGRRTLIFLKR